MKRFLAIMISLALLLGCAAAGTFTDTGNFSGVPASNCTESV